MSRPYQRETGIAGYTLIGNSYGMRLVAYEPFRSAEDAIRSESDIHSVTEVVQKTNYRLSIRDTDEGKRMQETIEELHRPARGISPRRHPRTEYPHLNGQSA